MNKAHHDKRAVEHHQGPLARMARKYVAERDRSKIPRHEATDTPIEAQPHELEAIRNQLGAIEKTLAELFGPSYDRGEISTAARAKAADIIELNFDRIVE